jgi:hypothetical protein
MKLVPDYDDRAFASTAGGISDLIDAAGKSALNATSKRVVEGLRDSLEEHLDNPPISRWTRSMRFLHVVNTLTLPSLSSPYRPSICSTSSRVAHTQMT